MLRRVHWVRLKPAYLVCSLSVFILALLLLFYLNRSLPQLTIPRNLNKSAVHDMTGVEPLQDSNDASNCTPGKMLAESHKQADDKMKLPNTVVYELPVLIFSHNRPDALKSVIDQLRRQQAIDRESGASNGYKHDVIVSIDSADIPTVQVADTMADMVVHAPIDAKAPPAVKKQLRGYYLVSQHYRSTLRHVFSKYSQYDKLIIIEDDFKLSSDFLAYFRFFHRLLDMDPTLLTVSGWNDNGYMSRVGEQSPYLVHRSDFFPGLSWILTRKLWTEVSGEWPDAFWDDWLRHEKRSRGRSSLRPEISRVAMTEWGKNGVSKGEYYNKHISRVGCYSGMSLDWDSHVNDLSKLLKTEYDEATTMKIQTCPTVEVLPESGADKPPVSTDILWSTNESCVKLLYRDENDFKAKLKQLGLMDDARAGVYRTAYRGVVQTVINNRRVFLVPKT